MSSTTTTPAEEVPYTGVDNLEMMALAKNYNEFLMRQVMRYKVGDGPYVDFGAGTGTFAVDLRSRGNDVQCVECDADLHSSLRQRGFTAWKDVAEMQADSVDYFFSLNVLEHIEDDAAVMKQLFDKLKPGGRFYCYVPAFNVLFSSMDRKVRHFRRYRFSSMLPHLKAAGFEIEKANYVDSVGFFVSLLYKWIGNKQGDLNKGSLVFYDRVLFPISRVMDFALSKLLGKNLEVVARKPLR